MFSLKTRRLLRWLLPAAALLTAAAVLAALFFTGVLKLNTPSRERYPVRGVDVSSSAGGNRLAHPGGAGPLLRLYQGHRGQRLHGSPLLVQLGGGPENRPAGGGVPFLQLRQPGEDAGR